MNIVSKLVFPAAIALSAALPVSAQQSENASRHTLSGSSGSVSATASGPVAAADKPMSEGEVRKVNKDAKKITIRHGELKNLDMPPMTMVFQVADPAFLDKVKAGDKVNFVAEKTGGQFTVSQIEVKN